MRSLLILIGLIISSVLAVFPDEAYQVDYHHALLGLPREQSTFFHQPLANSKASLIYTLSEKSIIGAVNPKDGALVWRQSLSSALNSTETLLRVGEGYDFVASATETEVATWTASDGKLIWSQSFDAQGKIKDVSLLEPIPGELAGGAKDVLVLFQSSNPFVQRLDGETGAVKWQYGDTSGDVPYKLASVGSTVYLVSLHSTLLGGLKIRITDIDAITGQKMDSHLLSSDGDVTSPENIVFVGMSSAAPILAWTDKTFKALKINILGTKNVVVFNIDKKSEEMEGVRLHAPARANALPHFLVQYDSKESHWAEVYHIDITKATIKKAYDLPKLAGKGAFAVSTADANVHFTRIAKGGIIVVSSVSQGVMERYIFQGFGVPGLQGHPHPVHAISEVVPRSTGKHGVRVAVLLSSGDWPLILNGQSAWSRPEALTLAANSVFADLPQGERLARALAFEEHASLPKAYFHRLVRHVKDLQRLPSFVQELPTRILASLTSKVAPPAGATTKADTFGFHKIVVVATENGRLIGIDTANGGNVTWNVPVPNYVQDDNWEVPALRPTAHGTIRVKNSGGNWVFETATGKLLRKATDKAKVKGETQTTIKYNITDNVVLGYMGEQKSSPIWTFKPKDGEVILSISPRPAQDPVASIGKVLGDRRVLYKYLNPNLALITTVSRETDTAFVYLIDSVSGNVLHEAAHRGVDTTRPIASIVSENWLCYSFTLKSGGLATSSRGNHLVFSELMESSLPDDRGALGASANYSSLQPSNGVAGSPHVNSLSYHIPEEISHMAVSQTRQGITSRMLMVTLPESNSIVGLPLGVLDPRRPVGRDPTAMEQSEGLNRYTPVLEFHPQWYLNHKREVFGIDKIITEPAVLESTSLVFAYGLDVFGTRVTPSFSFDVLGKDFNKLQMLATVVALFFAVVVVAPIVQKKQINTRWQL
ncbi:DUF1620-domain-containing protein [Tothia fuscella]|uniref:ER membrane protein complex subunit 1 n=1 Tax=Tothia fuscella TaxID=1048955 RepID=A0A9P4NWB7_9PEZI|nr:DUF1620-domain-containing protein [Tothia fuscella]